MIKQNPSVLNLMDQILFMQDRGIDWFRWIAIDMQPSYQNSFEESSHNKKVKYFKENLYNILECFFNNFQIKRELSFNEFLYEFMAMIQSVKFPLSQHQNNKRFKKKIYNEGSHIVCQQPKQLKQPQNQNSIRLKSSQLLLESFQNPEKRHHYFPTIRKISRPPNRLSQDFRQYQINHESTPLNNQQDYMQDEKDYALSNSN